MTPSPHEATFPKTFRQSDAEKLGQALKNRRSTVLVGMKRVGISNFLRFFLNHPDVKKTYIDSTQKHIFIPVDLNDLVERETFPFWILTQKRISDAVTQSDLPEIIKKQANSFFLDSIQSQQLFITMDNIRHTLSLISENGYLPTVFFLRFDRMTDAVTHDFFANLQGVLEASRSRLAYVFTSVRPLEDLSPEIFTRHALSVFSDTQFIKPTLREDTEIIYSSLIKEYSLHLSNVEKKALFDLVDGHVQYLQYALIALHEKGTKELEKEKLFNFLLHDERIALMSEELLASFTEDEKAAIHKKDPRTEYLIKTGVIDEKGNLFNSLFEHFINEKKKDKKSDKNTDFSKKEYLLLQLLEKNIGELVEREAIIESVWPEVEEFGVSDWAIDRLVARVRNKLKLLNKSQEIITIKTRGYKLISS